MKYKGTHGRNSCSAVHAMLGLGGRSNDASELTYVMGIVASGRYSGRQIFFGILYEGHD